MEFPGTGRYQRMTSVFLWPEISQAQGQDEWSTNEHLLWKKTVGARSRNWFMNSSPAELNLNCLKLGNLAMTLTEFSAGLVSDCLQITATRPNYQYHTLTTAKSWNLCRGGTARVTIKASLQGRVGNSRAFPQRTIYAINTRKGLRKKSPYKSLLHDCLLIKMWVKFVHKNCLNLKECIVYEHFVVHFYFLSAWGRRNLQTYCLPCWTLGNAVKFHLRE